MNLIEDNTQNALLLYTRLKTAHGHSFREGSVQWGDRDRCFN